ncbi:transcriptional regulator, LysR family [Maridesulfovibrio salexigens DSM 2638]|uniref:Transcriptional regulator, LysR family n=2 Tax=Maridesulfovibrio salexigens TaxID=880 RepID=C6BTC1_MARSD|nr:transcriptional regulator, LysR family [Maridesulfovibrio salexigens DSM 2638]
MGIIMQDFLNDIPLLVEVARQKSFTKAAEKLNIGASTLSRRIKQLEERMGAVLFYRDTRNVELTDNGQILLDRCEFILGETQRTYESVVNNMKSPSGLVRVCMFRDLYDRNMKKALIGFADKYTDIRLELTFVEHPVDLRTEPYDAAFLIGPSIAPPLIARKLLRIEPFIYASPELFDRYPMPEMPEDLHNIPCIVLERFGSRWPMFNGKRQVTIQIEPKYKFSSVDICRDFALAGHGLTLIRRQEAEPYEREGRLIKVLPEWSGGFEHDVHIVTGSAQLPQRIRIFLDHIQEFYALL